MAIPYYGLVVYCIVVTTVFDIILSVRQYIKYRTTKEVPKQLRGHIDQETFNKSRAYGQEKMRVAVISSLFDLLHILLVLQVKAIPWLWTFSLSVLKFFRFPSTYLVTRCVVFFLIYQVERLLLSLPFNLYSTFVVEQNYGFNKQTLGFYLVDQMKMVLMNLVVFIPIFSLVLHIIDWGGKYFWIYVWFATLVFTLVFTTIYPEWIAPLFNKFTPFPETPLKNKIEELAQKVQFPLTKLFVIDGSVRSAHSNAYFYGFFNNKRIVVYDTLLKQVKDDDGVLAIIGHELGHYTLNHTIYNLIIHQIQILFFFYLFGWIQNSSDLFVAFGFPPYPRPAFIGLVLFSLLYRPINEISGLLKNALSRKFEYEADAFSQNKGYNVTESLIKIHRENLGNMTPDSWYSFAKFGHPTLVERIEALEALEKIS